jgi:hypothetical protein
VRDAWRLKYKNVKKLPRGPKGNVRVREALQILYPKKVGGVVEPQDVDEYVSRFFGGSRLFKNQWAMPSWANSSAGAWDKAAQNYAIAHGMAGWRIVGFRVRFK